MRSIFISYSRSDAEKARLVADTLLTEGLSVSRPDKLVPGSDWQAEILSAIRQCSVFVALIDEPTPNVMLELGYALGVSKPVLLIGSPEAQIPLDVASLPMARLDQSDIGSLFAIVEQLRNKSSANAAPKPELLGVRDQLKRMLEDADYLEQVSWREFESLVLAFLRELGFDAVQMPATHDGGYDILAKDPQTSFKAMVEVKKYTKSSMLGVSIVHQLLGALSISDASCAILVNTSGFSESARSMAKKAPRRIILLTLEDLVASTRETITTASR